MNQAWAGRCDGNRVLVFRGTRTICQKELKAMTSSDKALKGIKLFVSPEYENPSRQKREEAFFQSLWSAIAVSGRRWNRKRGLLKSWGFLREIILNTAGSLRKGAGLSESQEQDGEQG